MQQQDGRRAPHAALLDVQQHAVDGDEAAVRVAQGLGRLRVCQRRGVGCQPWLHQLSDHRQDLLPGLRPSKQYVGTLNHARAGAYTIHPRTRPGREASDRAGRAAWSPQIKFEVLPKHALLRIAPARPGFVPGLAWPMLDTETSIASVAAIADARSPCGWQSQPTLPDV